MLESLLKNRELESTEAYYQARRAYQLDPKQDFIRVKNRIGLAGSLVYAQIYFSENPRYRRFRRELELHKNQVNALNQDHDVLIVLPPRGTFKNSIIQEVHRQTMGLATSAGFSLVSQAQLNTDRVVHGAKRLHQLIQEKARQNRKVIIVSHSYGSAFVRVMLDQSADIDLQVIKGWVNFSGMIFGCPLYDCSNKMKMFFSTTPSQRTYSFEQTYFKKPLRQQSFKSVHFLGLKSQMTSKEWRDRERLKAWGPSDGLVPFAPYQKLNETVVPLLDQGHIIDLNKLSLTFVNTLSAMVSTLPMAKDPLPHSELKNYEFIE